MVLCNRYDYRCARCYIEPLDILVFIYVRVTLILGNLFFYLRMCYIWFEQTPLMPRNYYLTEQ